jgi:hypothetical protein
MIPGEPGHAGQALGYHYYRIEDGLIERATGEGGVAESKGFKMARKGGAGSARYWHVKASRQFSLRLHQNSSSPSRS